MRGFRNILCLMTRIMLLLLCGAAGTVAAAAPFEHGLIRNSSGLPAVFPLQVRTPEGTDFRLTLLEPESGDEALAAGIRGGEFFKVLVPPGNYVLRFEYGRKWQDEETRFGSGPDAGRFDLADPLHFEIRGASTKAGHLVDLGALRAGEVPEVTVTGQYICQSRSRDSVPFVDLPARTLPLTRGDRRYRLRRPALEAEQPQAAPRRSTRWLVYPNYTLQSRYCDG